MAKTKATYGLSPQTSLRTIAAPDLPYRPQVPKNFSPDIGLIGCGGITEQHLNAYTKAGLRVVALCDVDRAKAEARRKTYYPKAAVYTEYRDLIKHTGIEVVDVATHPHGRPEIIRAAIRAGKHVLSQKPFVLDLNEGARLADLADAKGVRLAVNQNGRWAPHFAYMREAVKAGCIGDVNTVDFTLHWDHNWVVNTVFNNERHLLLYDFAIHWFDMAAVFFTGRKAIQVYASIARSRSQRPAPPLIGHAVVEFEDGVATLGLNGDTPLGQEDRTDVAGTLGLLRSVGPSLSKQAVSMYSSRGIASPRLKGTWFPDGFHGAMAELLNSIAENRQPLHHARANLDSLALCFAAVASADRGRAIRAGTVKRLK
ncbi:MAG: hypothetical protein AMXMBFR84_07330 [Candidatus Hydrogenedentota bacterium]